MVWNIKKRKRTNAETATFDSRASISGVRSLAGEMPSGFAQAADFGDFFFPGFFSPPLFPPPSFLASDLDLLSGDLESLESESLFFYYLFVLE